MTLAGGMTVLHIPGHWLGQVALLWPQQGGVLFIADACINLNGLVWTFVYEDFAEGKRSLQKLAGLDFQVACFGHDKPIGQGAGVQFREWVNKNLAMRFSHFHWPGPMVGITIE